MTTQDLTLALLRTTLATAAAACVAALLLAVLRVQSPRTHRIAWSLVILQGWLLFPWTLQIETPPEPTVDGVSDADFDDILTSIRMDDPIRDVQLPSSTWSPPSPAWFTAEWTARLLLAWYASATILAWLAGAAALALFAAWRYARIIRTLPLGAAPDDPQWQTEWRQALALGGTPKVRRRAWLKRASSPNSTTPRADLGVPPINLRITENLGPLLAFVPWQYLILAPRVLWTALTSPERTAILRHELAHLRRHDLWKSLAIRAFALPQWFNPLVWLAVRRFDEAAEWACDASAASPSPSAARGLARNSDNSDEPDSPVTLASALLRTAELCTQHASPKPTIGFIPAVPRATNARRRSKLTQRIERLITPRFKEESTMKLLAIPLLLASIAAAQLIRIERVAAESPTAVVEATHNADVEIRKIVAGHTSDEDRLEGPPHAGRMVKLPTYIIEAPDIIAIDASKLVPKADDVSDVSSVAGQHLVAMDGRVNLGDCGSVFIAGMTIAEARLAIEKTLADNFESHQIAVDVTATNSKVYYIITKGGSQGDDVVRAPITGNETVIDAIASLGGTPGAEAKVWIARPPREGKDGEQILEVDWAALGEGRETVTNYQLFPGDRLFIHPKYDIAPDDVLAVTVTRRDGKGLSIGSAAENDAELTAESVTFRCPVDEAGMIAPRIAASSETIAMAGLTVEQAGAALEETFSKQLGVNVAVKVAFAKRAPEQPTEVTEFPELPAALQLHSIDVLVYANENVAAIDGPPFSINRIEYPDADAAEFTVACVLARSQFANDLRQGVVQISLRRPTDDGRAVATKLNYDPAAPAPNDDGDRQLRPGDRLYVTLQPRGPSEFDWPLKGSSRYDGGASVDNPATESPSAGGWGRYTPAKPARGPNAPQHPTPRYTPSIDVVLKWTPEQGGEREITRAMKLAPSMTLGDVLKTFKLRKSENAPTDYSEGIITLSRAIGPPELGGRVDRAFRWDGAKQQFIGDGDETLLSGDRITIDLRKWNSEAALDATEEPDATEEFVEIMLKYAGGELKKHAMRLTSGMTVAGALKEIVLPHPIDFNAATLTLVRPSDKADGAAAELPIVWNRAAGRPTTKTDYDLRPADRIVIEISPSLTAASPAAPVGDPFPCITLALKDRDGDTKIISKQQLLPGMKVGDVFYGIVHPLPNSTPALSVADLADARITLTRRKREFENGTIRYPDLSSWTIGWDSETQKVVASDDRELEEGDMVTVDLSNVDNPSPKSSPAPAPSNAPPILNDDAQQVLFKISVIEDRAGDMADLGADLRETGSMHGDSTTVLGSLRVFEKHDLIKTLADPVMVTIMGRKASIEVHAAAIARGYEAAKPENVAVEIKPVSLNRDGESPTLRLEIRTTLGESVDRGYDLRLGETVILAIRPPQSPDEKAGPGQTYIVVTPEVIE